jgi:glycosyltransferase involved in cell wall biosynthesis
MTATSSPDSRPPAPGPRLAVICDLAEENWPSMELVADKLIEGMTANGAPFQVERVRPPMRRRFTRAPGLKNEGTAFNADRLINRMRDYPRYLRRRAHEFDLFHLTDHSYAHLVHELDPARTGVFCHDLDTFRCLLKPAAEPRPYWFRRMARRILTGLQKAAIVFHTTENVRAQIEKFGLIDPARLVKAPYGVAEVFQPGNDETEIPSILCAIGDGPFLLHVGSCIPRKCVEVLFEVLAQLRKTHADLRLLQVGGTFTEQQRSLIERFGVANAIFQVPRMDQPTIAALYRRAALVLMPSEAEGFGLPVIEALACGAVVVASDIPVFREVGDDAVVYCPLGDIEAWTTAIANLLKDPKESPDRDLRLTRAAQFTWTNHAKVVANAYQERIFTE